MTKWIKTKRKRPEEQAFYPEKYDVSMLNKVSLVLDVLREDVQFFDTIRRALANGHDMTPQEYEELVGWRKENVLTMVEHKYSDWILHRLESPHQGSRVLSESKILEPCYGHLLDFPQIPPAGLGKGDLGEFGERDLGNLGKREKPTSRDRLAQKMRDLERGIGEMETSSSSTRQPAVVKKEVQEFPGDYKFLPYTQSMLGGPTACTSISLAVASVMRDFDSIHDVINQTDWRRFIALGVAVWKTWKTEISETPERTRSFQTIYDLMKMPKLKSVFDKFGGPPAEYGGNIDGSVSISGSSGSSGSSESSEIEEQKAIYPSLKESLDKMLSYPRGAVAVATIGSMSVSIFAASAEDGFLIFDSHNSAYRPNHCTLARAHTSTLASSCICDLCGVSSRNNRSENGGLRVGTEIVRGTYCIYIFPRNKK
jgi:hypothetical protein